MIKTIHITISILLLSLLHTPTFAGGKFSVDPKEIQANGFRIVINDHDQPTWTWLVVNMTITNTTDEAKEFNTDEFELVSEDGTTYYSFAKDKNVVTSYWPNAIIKNNISAKTKIKGDLVIVTGKGDLRKSKVFILKYHGQSVRFER